MFSWFLTRNGRVFTHFSFGIAAASVFASPLVLHGPLLQKYQAIFQIYIYGKPQELTPDVLARAKKVLNECNLSEAEKQQIKFFNVVGRDICHAGGTNSPWGAIIGLPFTFEAKNRQDLSKLKIVGFDDDVDLRIESPELIDALAVPEKAQKFAVAREIYSSNIYRVAEKSFVAAFCLIFFPAETIRKINSKYQTIKLPLHTRIMMYVGFYGLGFLIYKCLKDPTMHLYDKKCDEKVASLGSDYLEGGIQFYENMLLQNQEMRQLLKKQGESLYTKDGDVNYFLFVPKLPITKRLEYLKELQKKDTKA